MRVPSNISKNVLRTYHNPQKNAINATTRILRVNLTGWNANIPKRLSELCISTISNNWKEHPIVNEIALLSDICALLDELPTDSPLHLTVAKIEYDVFWLRCYKAKWPRRPPPGRNFSEVETLSPEKKEVKEVCLDVVRDEATVGEDAEANRVHNFERCCKETTCDEKTWKQLYLEMHLQETLERLEPENYDPEKMQALSSMCGNYVTTLNLNEMRAPTVPDAPDHVPLTLILSTLPCLTELCICFKQTYVAEKFSWHIFNTTMVDVKNLARGLAHTRLKILRIRNSDINCSKVKMLLQPLLNNGGLTTMDFSHCKISDHGTMAICKFVMEHGRLENLILGNNYVGPEGAQGLAYILSENCSLKSLDLRLNIVNYKGGRFLSLSLCDNDKLRTLTLAGCGLTSENVDFEKTLRANRSLENLDLSNNRMGEGVGKLLSEALNHNRTLKTLDARRCNFTPETEWGILEKVQRNRKASKRAVSPQLRTTDSSLRDLFSERFVSEFNAISLD